MILRSTFALSRSFPAEAGGSAVAIPGACARGFHIHHWFAATAHLTKPRFVSLTAVAIQATDQAASVESNGFPGGDSPK